MVDSKALDLLEQMLVYNPSKRLSAKRALLHPYFDSLDKQALPAKPGEYQIKWIYPQDCFHSAENQHQCYSQVDSSEKVKFLKKKYISLVFPSIISRWWSLCSSSNTCNLVGRFCQHF